MLLHVRHRLQEPQGCHPVKRTDIPMTTYTDTEKFLQAIFPEHGHFAVFANLNPADHKRDWRQLDPKRDCYWSIAAFPDDGSAERTLARATAVRALVVDDVGSKVPAGAVELALGRPTAIVETSAGNFQWVYRLTAAVAVAAWAAVFAEAKALIGAKLEGRDAVHLFRLPMGVNTKPGKDGFAVRLEQLNSGVELNLAASTVATAATASAPGMLGLEALAGLMRLIPNDLERDGWVEVGHGLKALCADDEDGFAVFDSWSQTHDSYDAGKTRTAWDSFGASGLRTAGGQLRARAEQINPSGFAKWVFDDGEVPTGPVNPKSAPHVLASGEFVEGFIPPDYLVKKLITKAFLYSLTGQTGAGKTSITLRLAATVALGRSFGGLGTKPFRVLYLAAENPVDIQMRWIALADEMGFDVNAIAVFFVKARFKIGTTMKELRAEAVRVGGKFGLVVVDTGPVFFEGEDANDRVAMLKHAEMMRKLIEVIPGAPAVIVNVHPVKNAGPDNLLPSGGGSFLNEVDGNLTCAKNEDNTIELSWQGKWRGVEFAPLHFILKSVTHPRIVDSDGDPMPTVVCEHLSMDAKETMERAEFADQDKLLAEMERNPRASAVDLAICMDWYWPNGTPAKSKVQRYVKTLIKEKRVKKHLQLWVVAGAMKAKLNGSDRTGPDLIKPAGPKKH